MDFLCLLESITSSIFQVRISSLQVGGSGVGVGQNPTSLAVRGYVGNGQPDASDFQAGTILDTVNLSSPVNQKVFKRRVIAK